MTNSSSRPAPAAAGAAAAGTRSAHPYARFIPREELGSFASWTPGSFGGEPPRGVAAQAAAAAAPPPTSEAEWLQRIDEARRQGSQDGYQNGYQDGLVALESFKANLATQGTAQVSALLTSIEREFEALQPKLAEAVARVAVELARQVLRNELSTEPALVNGVAQQALAALVHSARHVQLQLHPLDLPLVRDGSAEQLAARHATLSANPALARGDCIIESDLGTLDARVATRWAQATANLAAASPWPGPDGEDAA